ncbi:MAG: aminotransferase class I/II-fold pyridoxal phosphate-dependent enzyme [Spirochaetia bacterium]|jgi:glycine C-acetyltransferase
MSDLFDKCRTDEGYFGAFRARKDMYFTQPVLEGRVGPRMRFQGRDVIVWALNNYLGIAGREELTAAAATALAEHGPSAPMGSRLLTGNTGEHIELEHRFASFCQKPASIVFNYGYLGVLGTVSALVGRDDVVVIDSLSHASMIDATMLASGGRRFRPFKHNDMEDLERHLRAAQKDRKGGILIITEGVFGMKGNLAKLPEICRLKEKYGARLFVDDAHGFGVMGPGGHGTGEHLGAQAGIDMYFGTFAKTFAAIGGVTAAESDVVEWIRYNARTNVFAKALPLVYVRTVEKALSIIESEPQLRERMWSIAHRLQAGLIDLGFDIGETESPITPVYVIAGDEKTAMSMIVMLREKYGVFVSAVSYPVVPRGVILFRMIPTAAHSEEDVDRTLGAFREMRDAMRLDLSTKPSQQNR